MARSTITSQGQITVPKLVREALGVRPGDRIAFLIRADGTVVVEADTVDLLSLRGSVKSSVRGVTISAMHDAVRKGAAGR